MGFSRQEYWRQWPHPPPEDLPDPGTESTSLLSPALAGRFFTTSTFWEVRAEVVPIQQSEILKLLSHAHFIYPVPKSNATYSIYSRWSDNRSQFPGTGETSWGQSVPTEKDAPRIKLTSSPSTTPNSGRLNRFHLFPDASQQERKRERRKALKGQPGAPKKLSVPARDCSEPKDRATLKWQVYSHPPPLLVENRVFRARFMLEFKGLSFSFACLLACLGWSCSICSC